MPKYTAALRCDCGEKIDERNGDYTASPCGSMCHDCMEKHMKTCGVCRGEFR